MATREERLAKLEEKKAQMKAKQQAIEARIRQLQKADKATERKRDTRRKIIVGGLVLSWIEKGDKALEERVRQGLSASLVREDDRALFGLDAI